MPEHKTCRETNAREKMRMGGRRSKANAQDTPAPRSSTSWGSGKDLFKGGTQSRPKRTLTWKLGVDAKFDTDRLWVPSFSRTFSGAETTCGRALGIIKSPGPTIDPHIYRGLGWLPPILIYGDVGYRGTHQGNIKVPPPDLCFRIALDFAENGPLLHFPSGHYLMGVECECGGDMQIPHAINFVVLEHFLRSDTTIRRIFHKK